MEWSGRHRANSAACFVKSSGNLLAATCALMLAGCNPDNQAVSAAQPRGATVAFESVDGLPPGNSGNWCKISTMKHSRAVSR